MNSYTGNRARLFILADLDCFFVEVERLHNPALRGVPVVIGGRPGGRGVVAACSYEARAFGVRSAQPMGLACRIVQQHGGVAVEGSPSGAGRNAKVVYFLHGNLFGNYDQYSRRVQEVLRSEVPVFHAKSIDEFEMEVTGCERLFARDFGGVVPFAEHVRRRVRREVGLKLSIGIGPCGIVAKMASRHAKPDGVFHVEADKALEFLNPHDVQDVPGIGPATAAKLRAEGINSVGQLLEQRPQVLKRWFGIGMPKLLSSLHGEASGNKGGYFGYEDSADGDRPGPAVVKRKPKSIGHESTFGRDQADPAALKQTLWKLTESAGRRLRSAGLRCRHVTLKIRYSDFSTHTHGGFLHEATDVDTAIFTRVLELFAVGHTKNLRLRLVGVRLSNFSAGASQGRLFDTEQDRHDQRLIHSLDTVREKFGKDSLLAGPAVHQLTCEDLLEADSTAGIPTGFMHGR